MPERPAPTPIDRRVVVAGGIVLAIYVGLAVWLLAMASAAPDERFVVTDAPPLELTDQAGQPFSLASLRGHPVLVFFGYTHCPDVCPTTMADLGLALRQLPSLTQAHTQVVFVTSDPARDTTAVMKTWLANFDQGLLLPFVGLTASIKQIDSVAKSVGVPLAPPVVEKNGSVSVEHGSQTMAFVDGKASVLWLAGTTSADYAHDIGKLIDRVK